MRDRLIPKNIFKVLKKGFFQNTQIEKICFVIILSVVLFRTALRINLQEIFQTEKNRYIYRHSFQKTCNVTFVIYTKLEIAELFDRMFVYLLFR